MKHASLRTAVAIAFVPVLLCCSVTGQGGSVVSELLDDFEEPSAWLKGDPKTDLQQRDAAVVSSTEIVHEGTHSLCFRVRINWTARPGEKYAKGWPMLTRAFAEARDWSTYDFVSFWVCPKTQSSLKQERVLRVGFTDGETKKSLDWYTIPGLEPGKWTQVKVPLTLDVDWHEVTGIRFYVAEGWYQDGEAVDFYIDDMQIARYTLPFLADVSATARLGQRGSGVTTRAGVLGNTEKARLMFCLVTEDGQPHRPIGMSCKRGDNTVHVPLGNWRGGEASVRVSLIGPAGKHLEECTRYVRIPQAGRRTYLKLITFYTKPLGARPAEEFRVLNDSAYAGVAIPLVGSYDTEPVPEYDELLLRGEATRSILKIDMWPWVALNRVVGAPPDARGHKNNAAEHAKSIDYFGSIPGLDLKNETGARADFLVIWRNALRLAREWRSPGVMIDLEAYNNYKAYGVGYISEVRGESPSETIDGCKRLGADMAAIAREEFPDALVWSLFSRLERTYTLPEFGLVYSTVSYVTLGMMEYAKQHGMSLKYLCGGETTPGYCNKSVEILREKIAGRDRDLRDVLEAFPENFALAGTISPFHDYALASSFIQSGYEGSGIKTIEEFEPFFRTLFDAYDWVWIYASSAAKTAPYKQENSARYSRVLNRSLDASVKATD